MPTDLGWLVLLLVVVVVWLAWTWYSHPHPHPSTAGVTARVQRLLKPRTPDNCPACSQPPTAAASTTPTRLPLTPWCERKSRHGAPKRSNTQGFACPKPSCGYYRITDAQIHALGGDATEGKIERSQTLRCQACHTTVSSRRATPLYRLNPASFRVAGVVTALAEGLDLSAAVRVFSHRHATITTWLTRAGEHRATLHVRVFRDLHLPHIQLDESRTRLRSRAQAL